MEMNLKVKLYLENQDDKFMGIGVLWLLQKIEENNSLLAASQSLGISYSKAYSMIRNLEKALGHSILIRKRGGSDREGATLTQFAKEFMALYDSFQKECKVLLAKPFEEFKEKAENLAKNI